MEGVNDASEPVEIPLSELQPELLRAVIESFVLREGTDYGEREVSLDDKVRHVVRQIERGDAKIIFDPETESVDIVTKRGLARPRVSRDPAV